MDRAYVVDDEKIAGFEDDARLNILQSQSERPVKILFFDVTFKLMTDA